MATLTKRLRGGSLMFEIQWYANKQRKTIPLGKKYSEKTARDLLEVVNGKESRLVPIFPELKTELEALFFDTASEGKEYVINRYRNPKQNLGTMFGKVVRRAGLPEIPRPFDNMRMTRSNEVYNRWGAFKESQWIGHSARVRQDHYLMLTDDDFSEASKVSMELPAAAPQRRQGIRRKDMESAGR